MFLRHRALKTEKKIRITASKYAWQRRLSALPPRASPNIAKMLYPVDDAAIGA